MVIITFLSPGFSLDMGTWQNAGQWDWGISVRRHIACHSLFSSGLCHLNVMSGTVAAILYPEGSQPEVRAKLTQCRRWKGAGYQVPVYVIISLSQSLYCVLSLPFGRLHLLIVKASLIIFFLTCCQKHSNWYNG